jgi:hypothetical protein
VDQYRCNGHKPCKAAYLEPYGQTCRLRKWSSLAQASPQWIELECGVNEELEAGYRLALPNLEAVVDTYTGIHIDHVPLIYQN